jgi:hypothetical protein
MTSVSIRKAALDDAAGIRRVCSAGWRATYSGIYTPEEIEGAINEWYSLERICADIADTSWWNG